LKCTVATGNVLSATGCVSSTSLWNGGVLAAANPECKACSTVTGYSSCSGKVITCVSGYYRVDNADGTYDTCTSCGTGVVCTGANAVTGCSDTT